MFERCVYFNLNALTRRVNRIWDEAFRELGLTAPQGYLLRAVLAAPGIGQKRLAAEFALEKSSLTRAISALERRGLVRRVALEGREVGVEPTDEGRRLEARLEEIAKGLYDRLRDILGKKEAKALVRSLRDTAGKLER